MKNIWLLETQKFVGEMNTRLGIASRLAETIGGEVRHIPAFRSNNHLDIIAEHGLPDILVMCYEAQTPDYELAQAVRRDFGTYNIHFGHKVEPEWRAEFATIIVPDFISKEKYSGHERSQIQLCKAVPHTLTRQKLLDAAEYWRPIIGDGQQEVHSLILGGDYVWGHGNVVFTEESAVQLAQRVKKLVDGKDIFLAVSDSRRTNERMREIVLNELGSNISYFYRSGQAGENPYFGFLALSKVITVTAESRSMMCDAAFAGTVPELGPKTMLAYYPKHEIDYLSLRVYSSLFKEGCFKPLLDDTKLEAIKTKGFDTTAKLVDDLCQRLANAGVIEEVKKGRHYG